jgi:hypothetical protein
MQEDGGLSAGFHCEECRCYVLEGESEHHFTCSQNPRREEIAEKLRMLIFGSLGTVANGYYGNKEDES